jgi:hypothetical protein
MVWRSNQSAGDIRCASGECIWSNEGATPVDGAPSNGRGFALDPIPPWTFEAASTPHIQAFEAVERTPPTGALAIAFEMLRPALHTSRRDRDPLFVVGVVGDPGGGYR